MTQDTVLPVIVASENGRRGVIAAMALLLNGGSALDAVELACRIVEADPADHSVGYGGLPNLLGEVELDASIMDGRTLRAGAVAAVHGYSHPITLARRVMEQLPHLLLVGNGAERFAEESGCSRADLLDDEAREHWRERLTERFPDLDPDRLGKEPALAEYVRITTDPERTTGTVNFIAMDSDGNVCAGVSTSLAPSPFNRDRRSSDIDSGIVKVRR